MVDPVTAASTAAKVAPLVKHAVEALVGKNSVGMLRGLVADDVRIAHQIADKRRKIVAVMWEQQHVDIRLNQCLAAWLVSADETFVNEAAARWRTLLSDREPDLSTKELDAIVAVTATSLRRNFARAQPDEVAAIHGEAEWIRNVIEISSEDVVQRIREIVSESVRDAHQSPDATSGTGRIRFNLPVVAAAFTGRDAELTALHDALARADSAVVTQAIAGLGGVGKSQLAARYVYEHADEYEIVAWISAQDRAIADLARLADRLGVVDDPELSPADRAQRALGWLGECDRSWLLVLDNVESAEQLAGLLPRSGRGRALVTSRDRSLAQFGPVLTVDVLDEEAATRYLTQRAERPHDDVAARELARALGYLPLALSHAAAYCQHGASFEEYLDLLVELPAHELFNTNPEVFYEQTIASTWKASIDAAIGIAALAGNVLELAAHLAPDAIPKALFALGSDQPLSTQERRRLTEAFNALSRYGLATVDDSTLGVHRLLQKVVRDGAADRGDRSGALHALIALGTTFPADVTIPESWPLCEQLFPHVLALTGTLERVRDGDTHVVDLLRGACQYLTRAEPAGQRALATARLAVAWSQRKLGTADPRTRGLRINLAVACRAAVRDDEAIAILESLLGDGDAEKSHIVATRNELALAYQDAGRIDEAVTILEALVSERSLNVEHPDTLAARHNLGRTYQSSGRIDEAIAILEPLLADCTRILGAGHPDTLTAGRNLALAYQAVGRIGDVIAIIEPLLTDTEHALDAEHPNTLATRQLAAFAYQVAGRTDEAIAIYEPLLIDTERILGTEHTDTLDTRRGLAIAYQAVGRNDEAIAILEPRLTETERNLGAEDPGALTARRDLALAYQYAGRIDEAITMLEPLIADTEQVLGTEHSATLSTRNSLGMAYYDAGRADEAIAILEPLLADRERILGTDYPDTLETRLVVALVYEAAGRTDEAIAIYERQLKDREPMLGTEHPNALIARLHLAIAYQAAKRTDAVLAILEPLVTDAERILGTEHIDTLSTRHHLALAYQYAGRTADAITIYEPLLTHRERILGADHPDTLRTRNNLAAAYQTAEQPNEVE